MNSKLLFIPLFLICDGKSLCQERKDINADKPVVLTVCEALEQRSRFNGQAVALVGVLVSTPEGTWLSDKGCTERIATDDYVWDNFVWLDWNPASAPDPSGLSRMDDAEFNGKLELVRQRNELRQFRYEGLSSGGGVPDYSDRLVAVYGRFQSRKDLKPTKGKGVNVEWGNGYGHLNASPVQISVTQGSIRYF